MPTPLHFGATIRFEGKHIVLVGMMGVGKTTIGERLARNMNKPFIDTDRLIEGQEDLALVEIFKSRGEGYFRDADAAMIRTLMEQSPAVTSGNSSGRSWVG